MNNILNAPFMVETIRTATNMYQHGWDERNGGNISLMLNEEQVSEYLDIHHVLRTIPTGRNGWTGVGHGQNSPILLALQTEGGLTLWPGVLDGVVQQNHHKAFQAGPVSIQRETGGHLAIKMDPLFKGH